RRRRAQLPRDERREQRQAGDDRAYDLQGCPTDLVAADEAPDDPDQAGAGEQQSAQIEAPARPVALVEPHERERDEQQPEGDVEPEDPLPGDAVDDRAADERAEGDGEPADSAPHAEREPALVGRYGRREDR